MDGLVNKMVSVVTQDGRVIVGTLKGFDHVTNLILSGSKELAFSTQEGVEDVVLGLYVIRGDNVAVVGEVDEDEFDEIDFSSIRAEPLNPVVH